MAMQSLYPTMSIKYSIVVNPNHCPFTSSPFLSHEKGKITNKLNDILAYKIHMKKMYYNIALLVHGYN